MPRANRVPIVLNIVQQGRFWSKVNGMSDPSGCWLWSERCDPFGYGHFRTRKLTLKAHRVAWTLKRGEIPIDMTLDHLCRVPKCVNPAHLELVTNAENIRRGTSPTALNAKKETCPNGHVYDVSLSNGRRACRACMKARKLATYHRRRATDDVSASESLDTSDD